jgi:hypothetical protein
VIALFYRTFPHTSHFRVTCRSQKSHRVSIVQYVRRPRRISKRFELRAQMRIRDRFTRLSHNGISVGISSSDYDLLIVTKLSYLARVVVCHAQWNRPGDHWVDTSTRRLFDVVIRCVVKVMGRLVKDRSSVMAINVRLCVLFIPLVPPCAQIHGSGRSKRCIGRVSGWGCEPGDGVGALAKVAIDVFRWQV